MDSRNACAIGLPDELRECAEFSRKLPFLSQVYMIAIGNNFVDTVASAPVRNNAQLPCVTWQLYSFGSAS